MNRQLSDAVKAYRAAQAGLERAQAEAAERVARARELLAQRRIELGAAMVAAAEAGDRQVEIIRVTGLSRETVRAELRRGGVEPD